MRVVGYARVSTGEQGISVEAQVEAIKRYCGYRGLELIDMIIDDGVSGGSKLASRPGGARLLGSKGAGVVATKLDRLFRDAADCLVVTQEWDKKGVSLHLIDMNLDTGTAMGRAFLSIAAAFAELERAQIAERTRTAMAHKKSKKERISRYAPYGEAFDGDKVVSCVQEQEVISLAKILHEKGTTQAGIAQELEKKGFLNRNGKRFSQPAISRMLKAHILSDDV